MVVSGSGAEDTRFNVSIVDFVAVVTVNATDVLYTLTGDYVVVLVDSSGEYNITFPFSIAINGTALFLCYLLPLVVHVWKIPRSVPSSRNTQDCTKQTSSL